MKTSTKKRASAAEWSRRVADWTRSGLGAAEYAARIGVAPARLSWWRWYLRTHPVGTGSRGVTCGTSMVPVRFLPARVKEGVAAASAVASTPATVSRAPGARAAALEVAFGGGCSVRIEDGCNPEWVGDVLRVVRRVGGASC